MREALLIVLPPIQYCEPITLLDTSFTYCSSSIQCCKPITLPDASFTYYSSPYTMLRTQNIGWRKFYLLFLPLYNVANPQHCLTQVLLIVPPPIHCCESIIFVDGSFTYCYYPIQCLRTHSIAWRKFYFLFLPLYNVSNP